MTTIVINDKKKGAQKILDLLRSSDFATFIEFTANDAMQSRKQRLIKIPRKYDPLALAGLAEDNPMDLSQIRKGWTKEK